MTRPYIEITEEMIKRAEQYASRGLTYEQIANCLGMSHETFIHKRRDYPELSDAIKKGRSRGIGDIANVLYGSAKAGNTTAQIFYLKCIGKWREVDIVTNDHDDELQKAKEEVKKLKGDKNGKPSRNKN